MEEVDGVQIKEAYGLVTDKLEGWLETLIAMAPNMVVALLVLIAFYGLARLVKFAFNKIAHRVTEERMITKLLSNMLMVLVLGVGIFVSLSVLNLDKTVTSLLAGAGIIGLALGFAFQDTASNMLSGIVISIRKPIKVGDVVEVSDEMGVVKEISLRYTRIQNFQGQYVYIPNTSVIDEVLTNYSAPGERRIDIPVGVSYGDDLEKAERVAVEAVEQIDYRDKNKDVELFYSEFGDSSINFSLRFWINYPDQPGFLKARSDAIKNIKKAFDDNDITIPFPIRTMDFGIKGGEKLSTDLKDLEVAWNQNGNGKQKNGN
ncbi:MAG: mechanosensitive ion channel [Cytophagales bacterium]|nr:mechanosensitive ion channel [Cytophagales bacterium]